MNNKKFLYFLVLLPLLIFSGCKSKPDPVAEPLPPPPPPPVIQEIVEPFDGFVPITGAIFERVRAENIARLQFYISTDITLTKEDYAENEEFDGSGAALLTNTHIRNQVIIREKTKGILLTDDGENDGTTLKICFEQDNDNTLSFVQTRTYSEKKYYLKFEGFNADSGKGQLTYGGVLYQVDYNGDENPYLLISLTEQELEVPSARVLPGRSLPAADR
jgi:hypothetical protein